MKKIAFITGGATGIGAETVRELQRGGYFTVIFCNKSEDEAQKLCGELNENGENALYFKCDLSDYEQTKKAVTQAINLFGHVDALVNNAGIAQQKCFTDITYEDWKKMIDVNLTSVFLMCSLVAPVMIKNHSGKIINVSSMWGICGASCEVHYSASKAGVIGFTKALAQELGISGITVNCVAPGVIDTKMNSNLSSEDMEFLKEGTPLNKIGTPKDVANAISFLLSEKADFITGQVISPNGGFVV